MENTILFTLEDFITLILAVATGIITIGGAFSVVANWISKARRPEVRQNERISTLEIRVDKHDETLNKYEEYFKKDNERLRKIEESNRITQRSMLALLKHSINGEDLESLRKAEKDLEEYLINKAD